MHPPENTLEENRHLRRTMRDLVALSTLPAVWTGLSPDGIVRSLADVLLNSLSLELIYARLEGLGGNGVVEVVRNKRGLDAEHVQAVKAALAPVLGANRSDSPLTIPDPFGAGTLHIAITRFGIADDHGVLIAGSRRADFPSERDRLLLSVGANQTAIVIQRRRAEEEVSEQQERLRTTLACIGDAVIATDRMGSITTMNAVAESLTGWAKEEATGQPLDAVFRIVNEETRQTVPNPATRAIREGIVVGLANHTVLIAKDGTERFIDDSAAPIRTKEGQIVGCVLIFRDVSERRRLEKQIVEQGEAARKLAAIVDSSEDAIISKTLDGIIQSWNASAERVFGYAAEEAVGRPITMLFPADRLAEEDRIIGRIRAGERVEHFDTVRLRKDGTPIAISLTISPIRDNEGRIIGASKIARDITERKRAEAAAAEHHCLTLLRADIAAALASAANPPTTLQRCTEAIVRHLDVAFARIWMLNEAEQVLELRASAGLYTHLNGPHSRVKVGEFKIGRIAASRQPHLTNDVRHDPNISDPAWAGREGMVAFAGFPLMTEGRVLGVVALFARRPLSEAVVSDLGTLAEGIGQYLDRKRAEERLRLLSEAAAVILYAPAPDALVRTLFAKIGPTIGADSYFNYIVNETGDGLRLASCIGIPEEALLPHLGFGEMLCGMAALHRQPVVVAHVQQCSDPKAQAVRSLGIRAYAGFPLMSGNLLLGTLAFASRSKDEFDPDELAFLETICHYVAVAYERLRLLEKLRQADHKKDEFLAILAHELRNPLAPIRNGLQLMQMAGGKAETVEQARTMMERQIVQMVRLVDDLMDLTRISRGKIELKKQPVELVAVVNGAVEIARPLIEEMGHELTVLLPEQPIILEADTTRLTQVFSNLLTNAAKYTDRGGRIWLTAERQGSDVVVAVKDTGIGIPADRLRSIFEMFSQVEAALSQSQGGLGIGLCLVNRLVQMHGGSIEAESEGPGRGSRFVVRLPLVGEQREASMTGDNAEAAKATSKLRILVVDDNRDAAESLAMLLKIMGNNVRTASDGEKGVQAAAEFRPHVMLMDIGLPKLNGYGACRLIREQAWSKNMVIIAVTGWGAESDRRKSQEAGFDYHMVKPVDPTSLMKLLADLSVVKA
ncbi:MAG: hybrid sensor histidine kinase/response regulator [Gemmataceae bacterium]